MAASYTLRIEQKKGYLHARITGENTPEVTRAYVVELIEACRKAKCPAVLIEENLEGPRMGMGELYSIVHDLHAEFRAAIHVAAFVDVNSERSDASTGSRSTALAASRATTSPTAATTTSSARTGASDGSVPRVASAGSTATSAAPAPIARPSRSRNAVSASTMTRMSRAR